MQTATALDWLLEQMPYEFRAKYTYDLFKQAKEMEKKQIADAYLKGDSNGCGCYDFATPTDAEEYYNEKYLK